MTAKSMEWWDDLFRQMSLAEDCGLVSRFRFSEWDGTDYLVMADGLMDADLPVAAEWLRAIGEARSEEESRG